ncbi:hypothetical protein L687_05225 [Microbacterium maritypicum MF109]|uniref:Uncharacterized protein n=1 Tax=Microbacterium maritypicum MF109 TaxID=1333857 RepID=T5KEE3_MICMQ|nr:hypothetical protein L687_05225 [Microbacterium maritypicum MF109]
MRAAVAFGAHLLARPLHRLLRIGDRTLNVVRPWLIQFDLAHVVTSSDAFMLPRTSPTAGSLSEKHTES